MSSRSATPSARQAAPTCIIISSDDSTDSETSKKKDPVFVPDGVVKREATSTDGVVTTGDAGGPSTSTAVPRRPPVSACLCRGPLSTLYYSEIDQ